MSDPWKLLKTELENYFRFFTPAKNRHICNVVINLIEQALHAWVATKGPYIRSSEVYEVHYRSIQGFRERLRQAGDSNIAIARLRRDILNWRDTFMLDSVRAKLKFPAELQNIRELARADGVGRLAPNTLPPPGQPAPSMPQAPPIASPTQPRHSARHVPPQQQHHAPSTGPPLAEPRQRAASTWGRTEKPPVWPALTGPLNDKGLSPMPAPRSRQPSEASQSSRLRQRFNSSASRLPPRETVPARIPAAKAPYQTTKPEPFRRTHKAQPPSISDILHPELLRRHLLQSQSGASFPTHPQPAPGPAFTPHTDFPPGSAQFHRDSWGQANQRPGFPPGPAASMYDLRGSRYSFDSYDEALAYDLQQDEFDDESDESDGGPATYEARRRKEKGKGRDDGKDFRRYDYGPGGPSAGGSGSYGGSGSAGGTSSAHYR